MTLMALDPSSTRTGFAVFNGQSLVAAGWIGPTRQRDVADDRIDVMVDELQRLLGEHDPEVIVIETPSGREGRGSRAGATGHLAIYGLAVGEIRRACKAWERCLRVESVTEREWTRGRPKRVRQRDVAMRHPQYAGDAERDRGGDAADAIGLGEWWLQRERAKAACS